MAGAVAFPDLGVVLGALVGVLDHQRDRCSGRALDALVVMHDAGEDAHRIGLAPLGRELRLSRLAAVEKGLDLGLGDLQQRRAAVDHAAKCRTVALAPGRDAEEVTETVVRHGRTLMRAAERTGLVTLPVF